MRFRLPVEHPSRRKIPFDPLRALATPIVLSLACAEMPTPWVVRPVDPEP